MEIHLRVTQTPDQRWSVHSRIDHGDGLSAWWFEGYYPDETIARLACCDLMRDLQLGKLASR